jgi:hypothetical protein
MSAINSNLDFIQPLGRELKPFAYLDHLDKALKGELLKYYQDADNLWAPAPHLTREKIQLGNLGQQKINDSIDFIRRDFFSKNLDSVSWMPESVQSEPFASPLLFLLKELKDYSREDLTLEEKDQIERAINSLCFILRVGVDIIISQALRNKGEDEKAAAVLNELSNHLIKQISTLQVGDKMAIPGGGIGSHNMVYEFIRTGGTVENPLFQMKIYNGGEGAEHHSRGILGWLNPWQKNRTYVIQNISLENIIQTQHPNQKSFLHHLIDKTAEKDYRQSTLPFIGELINTLKLNFFIHSIYRLIHVSVLKDGASIDRSGPYHQGQKQGSCGRKTYHYLLKESFLEKQNYLNFKVFLTEKSIHQLKEVHEARQGPIKKISRLSRYLFHTGGFARFLFFLKNEISNEALLDLGQDVLERRRRKLLKKEK